MLTANRRFLTVILISLTAISCRDERFRQLDEAISNENVYAECFTRRIDSLRNAYDTALNDTIRWECLYESSVLYGFYDIDSAAIYASQLLAYLKGEAEYVTIAKSQYAGILLKQGKYDAAESILNSINCASLLSQRAQDAYYTSRISLCQSRISNEDEKQKYLSMLAQLKEDLRVMDSTTLMYKKVSSQVAYYNKDYQRSIDYILSIPIETLSRPYRAEFNYHLARCYEKLGATDKMIDRLTASAITDIQMNSRIYSSLNALSFALYSRNDYERANRYAKKALHDATLSKYPGRLLKSAATASFINDKTGELQHKLNRTLIILLSVISALFMVSLILLIYNINLSHRFESNSIMLSDKTLELNKVSSIQNLMLGYYMELSAGYIESVDQMRSSLRRTLKQDGVDAMVALLRGPAFADSEFPNFYTHFDKAFLSIFPKFIEQVNALLKEEMRFQVNDGDNLPTELRILALIRLGITDSCRIANVLHVSRGTVYTYRSAMRVGALCDTNDFENQVARLC